MSRTPGMHDPADQDIHEPGGEPPHPTEDAEVVAHSQDDLADPAETDPSAPHDRGIASAGRYEDGGDSMEKKVRDEAEAWRKGRTQDRSPH